MRNSSILSMGMVAISALVVCLGQAPALLAAGECDRAATPGPRTLVLALDGMPLRVLERAREEGAFAGWAETRSMISTFPSVTNVSFTMMFGAFGAAPAGGYEVRYYDWERNELVGGKAAGYKERGFAWRDYFDVVGRSLGSKLAVYTTPSRKSRKELEQIEQEVLQADRELVLAHVGSSDALQHIRGDAATFELLLEVAEWLQQLQQKHLEQRGEPLRIVLISDHGNSSRKIRGVYGVHGKLREADLDATDRLINEDDVIAASFGLVGFGAMYTSAENAETAARAVLRHKAVDIVAWHRDSQELAVISGKRRARIVWRQVDGRLRVAYRIEKGDPLRLNKARGTLDEAGLLDDEGFADDRDWLRVTAAERYPDALRRLIDAFEGSHVDNRASVLFSLKPGFAWGWKSAYAGSWLRGGRMEGTHGGLDADSSLGVFLASDPALDPGAAVRMGDAMKPFLEAWTRSHCTDETDTIADRDPGAAGPPVDSLASPD